MLTLTLSAETTTKKKNKIRSACLRFDDCVPEKRGRKKLSTRLRIGKRDETAYSLSSEDLPQNCLSCFSRFSHFESVVSGGMNGFAIRLHRYTRTHAHTIPISRQITSAQWRQRKRLIATTNETSDTKKKKKSIESNVSTGMRWFPQFLSTIPINNCWWVASRFPIASRSHKHTAPPRFLLQWNYYI